MLCAVLALLIPLIVACSGQPTPTGGAKATAVPSRTGATAAPATSRATKVKIRLATWAGVDEAKKLETVISTINATATTFEIIQEAQPADYYTKLQTNLAGGTAADLLWLSQEYIAGYAQKGVLLDISDQLAKDDRPAAKLDDYYPSVLQTAQYSGKTYGLPWIAQPVITKTKPPRRSTAPRRWQVPHSIATSSTTLSMLRPKL